MSAFSERIFFVVWKVFQWAVVFDLGVFLSIKYFIGLEINSWLVMRALSVFVPLQRISHLQS